ncbi:MAG: hypothetical protein KBE16_02440 [Alphaproteobacteria bacterium]|jgi:hypothetical protein|nr:hypothetical protein [Alphaproteobacteria bacterium]MBP9877499.1 hypothetical protein [Alphaproteobacteria bacterium]
MKIYQRLSCLCIVLASLFVLNNCGLRPVYYSGDSKNDVREGLQHVRVETIEERAGQVLYTYLVSALAYNHNDQVTPKTMSLKVSLKETIESLGMKKDGTSSRERISLFASYSLIDLKSGRELASFKSRSTLNYNLVSQQFSILTAKEHNRKKALKTLSADILNRVSLYLKTEKGKVDPSAIDFNIND